MPENDVVTAVLAALERDPDINLHECPIRVSLAGSLSLDGEVDDIIAKRKALRITARVAGTETIVDLLRLRPSRTRGDAELLDAALNALGQESAFRDIAVRSASTSAAAGEADHIKIYVRDGVINLRGTVGSLSHRRLAEVIAWWVPGCCDVDNRLRVHPNEDETDDEISDVVRLVLDKDPHLDGGQIHVSTRNGEITLDGVVHSRELKHIASENCWYIPGVHDVHNRLHIRPR